MIRLLAPTLLLVSVLHAAEPYELKLEMITQGKETLTVKRDTERILMPERGARFGNFGVCEVSENETWVTDAEWMQKNGPDIVIKPNNKYGAENSLYAVRLLWQDDK